MQDQITTITALIEQVQWLDKRTGFLHFLRDMGKRPAYYAERVSELQETGTERRGRCPKHNCVNRNFAVEPHIGYYYCHSRCQEGGDMLKLERRGFL